MQDFYLSYCGIAIFSFYCKISECLIHRWNCVIRQHHQVKIRFTRNSHKIWKKNTKYRVDKTMLNVFSEQLKRTWGLQEPKQNNTHNKNREDRVHPPGAHQSNVVPWGARYYPSATQPNTFTPLYVHSICLHAQPGLHQQNFHSWSVNIIHAS